MTRYVCWLITVLALLLALLAMPHAVGAQSPAWGPPSSSPIAGDRSFRHETMPGDASWRRLPPEDHHPVAPLIGWPPEKDVLAAPYQPPSARPAGPTNLAPPTPGQAGAEEPWTSHVFEPAVTVARIGDQLIFQGDLIGDANLLLAPSLEKMSPEDRQRHSAEISTQREALVEQLLKGAVDRKLMYLEFLRGIPADKLKQAKANIETRTREAFEQDLETMLDKVQKASPDEHRDLVRQDAQLFRLALIMKETGISTTSELDRLLRRYGSSLDKQQQVYRERMLGQQQMRKAVDFEREVTHEEMLAYYREHIDSFQVPAQARWEQLTVRFDRLADKAACGAAIAAMGNEVYYGGTPFWAVAKRSSQGPNADQGGYHDWTAWGDLTVSREIRQAVFSLPAGRLSEIIEDHEGLHIIRVIERRDAHVVPFTDAQVEIKKKLQVEKRAKAINDYVAGLYRRTPVWTVYDGDGPRTAEPASGFSSNWSR